ncbi:MAG: hypothetical protein RSA27_03415, partial [Oscillospiraceae bacterium]
MSGNRCARCNRKLSSSSAKYGWRCAEILGVSTALNQAGDDTFNSYMTGIDKANEFLSKNNINTDNINLEKFYEAMLKQCLAEGTDNLPLWKKAYHEACYALGSKFDDFGKIPPQKYRCSINNFHCIYWIDEEEEYN